MIIELLDGTRFDIEDYSLIRLFHRIPSLDVEHTTTSIEDRDGPIILETRFSGRTISVELAYIAQDIFDYYLLRDVINDLFARKEAFYIIFKREPYKRWKVRLAQGFETEPGPRMEPFTVNFICENIFAESIATTADIKEWDVDKWGWNGTIDWDEDLNYSFDSNSFTVKNLGNVKIDPREHELEIIIKATTSSYLQITNNTTGDVFRYNGALSSTDELKLTGIRALKNSLSVLKNTNKKVLTLAPGENEMTVEGGTLSSIVFNFRFLYK